MAMKAGLLLGDRRLTFVALRGRQGFEHMTLDANEGASAVLRAELATRRLKVRGVKVGLPRHAVTVKALELPRSVDGNLRQAVSFDLERHVPFPPEDMAFDFSSLPTTADGPLRVLIAAAEQRTVERSLRLLDELKLRPLTLTVACHDLAVLLQRPFKARRAVWAHRGEATADLVFLGNGRLRLSRTVPVESPDDLAAEIRGSLSLVKWRDCDAVWISGDETAYFLRSPALSDLGARVSEPPYSPAVSAFLSTLTSEEHGDGLLALAVAAGSRKPALNLLPEEIRPRTFSAGQLVTASMVAITGVLGLSAVLAQGYQDQRYVQALAAASRGLELEVRAVERLASELRQKKGLLGSLDAAEVGGLRPLPLLRELTEILPQEAWLSAVTLDGKGIEITGQASAASELIPLLESSQFIERVEFTSPVTRGRDKEQFRIRAVREGAAPPPETRPGAQPRPSGDRFAPGSGPGQPRLDAPREPGQPALPRQGSGQQGSSQRGSR